MDALSDEFIERLKRRVGAVVRGKYRLDALIGIGGTASVYAACHRNGNRVALKILHPPYAVMADVRARFLREGYVANRIAHPGIVAVLDDDDDDELGTVFLVLELLEGRSLAAHATDHGQRLGVDEVAVHAARVLDVLDAAHREGVVHRDVKPDNVFLTSDGRLKVLDFGIARLLDGTSATKSGQLLGTPAFMSPEQAGGRIKEIDARTDIWSVGAMMFTLITGRAVHEAPQAALQMILAATHPAPPIERFASDLPSPIGEVINRALRFERDARWRTAREMLEALARAQPNVQLPERTPPAASPAASTATTTQPAETQVTPATVTVIQGSGS